MTPDIHSTDFDFTLLGLTGEREKRNLSKGVRAVAGVPESRQYFINMKSQGIPCCPQCYDGCAKALEVGRIDEVCSSDFNSCPIYKTGLNSEELIGGRR